MPAIRCERVPENEGNWRSTQPPRHRCPRSKRGLASEMRQPSSLEQLSNRRRRDDTEVPIGQRGRDPATVRALQETLLDQERLEHVLDRIAFLADRRREVVDADRSARELVEHAAQELAVHHVESQRVHVEHGQRSVRDLMRDPAGGAHFGVIAHAPQQPVHDTRRAARAASDLQGARRVERDIEQLRRAGDDARELLRGIELEPGDDSEAVAQRIGEHPGACGRADQRERLQVELDRSRRRSLADHDVDLEILERGIENFLNDRRQAVDLVDEQHVVRFEVGQQRGKVAGALEHGTRSLAQVHAELVRDDVRQRRLAESRRSEEQHVVERFLALARGLDEDRQLAAYLLLPDVLVERARPQRTLEHFLLRARRSRGDQAVGFDHCRLCLCEDLQRLLDAVGDGDTFGQLLHRADRLLVAVAQREERVEHVGSDRRRAMHADHGSELAAQLVFELEEQPFRGLLADAGNPGEPARILHRHRLRKLRDREAGEHREGGARADAADLDELAKGTTLRLGAETEQQVRVLAYDAAREQGDRVAETRELVEGAHRNVDLVSHSVHVEQDLRRVFFDERSGKAADHGWQRASGRIIAWVKARSQNSPAAHAVALAPQAVQAFAAVGMADGASQRVGRVGRRRRRQREEPLHHLLHLALGRLAVADDRLLDLQRGVFGDRKIGEHRRADRRAARLTQKQRRAWIGVDEHLLDRDLRRTVLDDHAPEITDDYLQPFGQLADSVAHAAAGDVLELPAGRHDQPEPCYPQSRIDAENASSVASRGQRSYASSMTAFVYTFWTSSSASNSSSSFCICAALSPVSTTSVAGFIVTSASSGLRPAFASASLTATNSCRPVITSIEPSSLLTMSSALASSATSISLFSSVPGANTI